MRKLVSGNGTYLIELTPHQFAVDGQHAVGERVYGPYDNSRIVVGKVLDEIEKDIPSGNTIHVLELGDKRRLWAITGEAEKPARAEPPEEGSIGMIN